MNPIITQSRDVLKLKITFTANKTDVENLSPKEITWLDFIKSLKTPVIRPQKDGHGFCPATFKEGRKLKANALSFDLLVVEYDHNFNKNDLNVWMQWEHLIYSSHSHKRKTEKNPEAGERLRVVIPLAEAIDPENYDLLYLWAEKQSLNKIDPACKNRDRMFYLPAIAEKNAPFDFLHHQGEILNWRELGLKKETQAPVFRSIPAYREPLDLSDQDLIEKAMQAKNGTKFSSLWNFEGEVKNEHDQSLCNHLAYWTGKDPIQMDRLFRQSGIYREEKWGKRKDYRDRTIQKAIADCLEIYSPSRERSEAEPPPPLPDIEKIELPPCELPELEALISTLKPYSTLFFQAPTGLGKTHALIQKMVTAIEKRFVFFCSTNAEAMDVYGKTCSLLEQSGFSREEVFLLTSLEGVAQKKAIESARIVITNYGYLGRQGMTCKKHVYIEAILKDRIAICDEVQELYKKMKVSHPLRTRYLQKKKEYSEVKTCPKSSRKGDCESCIAGYLRREPDGRGNERDFFKTVPISSFQEVSKEFDPHWEFLKESGFETWEDLTNPQKYKQVQGTLYFKGLSENLNYSREEAEIDNREDSESYETYLKSLFKSLKNPQLRIEFPLVDKVAKTPEKAFEVSKSDSKETVQFPQKPCTLPTICGLDTWPLWQITKYSTSVIFTSATIPVGFHCIAKEISLNRGWHLIEKEVKKPPFKFDVTLLKTETKLGSKIIPAILKNLDKKPEKSFVVASRQSEARDVYKLLKRSFPQKTEFFESQDFEGEKSFHAVREQYVKEKKFLVTYARSAITRGSNLPDINYVFVECDQFIPQSALGTLKENMSTNEKLIELVKDILENLTQICGRVLRSNLKRELGQTIQDPRKIVFILHSLPKELQAFKIDEVLTFKQREFFRFVRTRKRGVVESVAEAISVSLDGSDPEEYSREKLKEEVTEDFKKGALRKMTLKDRQLLSKTDKEQISFGKKLENLTNKIKDLKEKGKSEREIKRVINYSRIKETCFSLFLELDKFFLPEKAKTEKIKELKISNKADNKLSSKRDDQSYIDSKSRNDDTFETYKKSALHYFKQDVSQKELTSILKIQYGSQVESISELFIFIKSLYSTKNASIKT